MMGEVLYSGVADSNVSDSESECGDDGSTGIGDVTEPPSYAQVSSYFIPLGSFADSCKNDEAAHYLQKARMSFSKAYMLETSAAGRHTSFRERIVSLASKL